MPAIDIEASADIDAAPAVVYRIIADYREGHPRILPSPPFEGLTVERGGYGEGTRIRVTMRMFGRTRTQTMEITEPEPGRMLHERVVESGILTSFTVDPLPTDRTRVTIRTTWKSRGLQGWVEQLLARPALARVYRDELQNLAKAAAAWS